MTTNDTVSEASGPEQASLTKGQLQRIQERERIEKRLREARRARWSLPRRKRSTGSPESPGTADLASQGAKGPVPEAKSRLSTAGPTKTARETSERDLSNTPSQNQAVLTPAQQQRRMERKHVENVVRQARHARWTFGKPRPSAAAEGAAGAEKAETRIGRSTRTLVAAALILTVALIGFSIHSLVQRASLNRDLARLIEQTQRLAGEQASTLERVQTELDELSATEGTQTARTEELWAQVEAATVAGFADVSARLGQIDALTEAVQALALRDTERDRSAPAAVPGDIEERGIPLPSGWTAILTVPAEARQAVLLLGAEAAAETNGDTTVEPLRRMAEYLSARGSVVLRFARGEATATLEEDLTAAADALDALLGQPEAAEKPVTVVAYGDSAALGLALAEARPEVASLALLAPAVEAGSPEQRVRKAVQILGPIDEATLAGLESWIASQESESP